MAKRWSLIKYIARSRRSRRHGFNQNVLWHDFILLVWGVIHRHRKALMAYDKLKCIRSSSIENGHFMTSLTLSIIENTMNPSSKPDNNPTKPIPQSLVCRRVTIVGPWCSDLINACCFHYAVRWDENLAAPNPGEMRRLARVCSQVLLWPLR